MNECKVIDCKNIERLLMKCKLPFIHVNDKGECIDYMLDMNYLRATLRAKIKTIAPNFRSADSDTEVVVLEATRLLFGQNHHAPSVIAGEKENRDCQE